MRSQSSPTPDIARASKERIDSGIRLPEGNKGRPYYCRTCGENIYSDTVPKGWYSLSRHTGDPNIRTVRLGMYCSIECLEQQMPRLKGISHRLDERGSVGEDSPYVQRRSPR